MATHARALDLSSALEPQEIEAAGNAARQLANTGAPTVLVRAEDEPEFEITLPQPAVKMLVRLLAEMANGNSVSVVVNESELTTQQAADFLNISRPYLIKLVERGEIDFHMVNTHRRLKARDVISYRDREAERRNKLLDQMVAMEEELGIVDELFAE